MVASIALETLVMKRNLKRNLKRRGNCRSNARKLTHLCALLGALLLLSTPLSARTYAVVVSGLGGSAEYKELFRDWSDVYTTALNSLDIDDSLVVTLDALADKQAILDAIDQQAKAISLFGQAAADGSEASGDTTFILILAGHGTTDSNSWRFNIDGPDLTTEDLVAALNPLSSTQQLIILAASASGSALEALSQPGRVVVTATKSGGEVNAVRFPGFLAEAMQSDVADYDRNEILTIAEAYRFAEGQTRDYYEAEKLLASEHSRLRGDGAADIAVALLGSLKDAKDDPVVARLLDQRLLLEQDFKSLKLRKPDMPVDKYYDELETLLLSIANLQRSIDEETGWSEKDASS